MPWGFQMVQTDETDCEIEQFLDYWQDKVDSVFVARYHSPKLAVSGTGKKRGRCLYLHHSTAINTTIANNYWG